MPHDVVETFGTDAQIEVLTTDESVVEVIVPGPQGPQPSVPASIHYIFDGGGVALSTGLKGSIIVPFDCTIDSWTLVGSPSGSVTVDIWKSSLAAYPPNAGNSICGGAKPALSSSQKATSSALGAWDTAIAEGDVLSFNIDSAASITLASIALKVTRA